MRCPSTNSSKHFDATSSHGDSNLSHTPPKTHITECTINIYSIPHYVDIFARIIASTDRNIVYEMARSTGHIYIYSKCIIHDVAAYIISCVRLEQVIYAFACPIRHSSLVCCMAVP